MKTDQLSGILLASGLVRSPEEAAIWASAPALSIGQEELRLLLATTQNLMAIELEGTAAEFYSNCEALVKRAQGLAEECAVATGLLVALTYGGPELAEEARQKAVSFLERTPG